MMRTARRAHAWWSVAVAALFSRSVRKFYDSIADVYDDLFGMNQRLYAADLERLLCRAPSAPFARALDLGSGTGILACRLAGIAECTVSLDLSAGLLRRAGGGHRVCGDARTLPFAACSFELVTSLSLLTHVPVADLEALASEIDRVSLPRAALVLALPPLPWRIFRARRSTFRTTRLDRLLIPAYNLLQRVLALEERRGVYRPERLRDVLEGHGYSVESLECGVLAVMVARREGCNVRTATSAEPHGA